MRFEWDPAKDAANLAKHGISFAVAAEIFEGPVVTGEDRRTDYGERREISIGRTRGLVVVVVVHTDREGRCRIISARRASREERSRYESIL